MVRDTLERVSISARSYTRGQLSRFEWRPHSFVLFFYSVVFLNPGVHARTNCNGSLCRVGRAHHLPGEIAMDHWGSRHRVARRHRAICVLLLSALPNPTWVSWPGTDH